MKKQDLHPMRVEVSVTDLPVEPWSPPAGLPSPFQRLARSVLVMGVALCSAISALGQDLSWSEVDDVENGWEWGVAADSSGNIFVAGEIADSGLTRGCIRKSTDRGATWETMIDDEVTYYDGIASKRVETVPATTESAAVFEDHLVVAGQLGHQWITRRSRDAGETWETVDVYTHPSAGQTSGNPEITALGVDHQGNIFVAGFAVKRTVVKGKTTSAYYWLIRRITRGATASSDAEKTTFDLIETANGGYSWPKGIAASGTDVFIAGTSGDRWQVRKNSGGGANWELVDDFRYDANYASGANGITVDATGTVYVVGMGRRAADRRTTRGYWIVRKGSGVGANSFQTVDTFEYAVDKTSVAEGVAADGAGNVYVTGAGGITANRWITRQYSASTGLWTTTDDYAHPSAQPALGRNIVAGPSGTVFTSGVVYDSFGAHEWVVRRGEP